VIGQGCPPGWDDFGDVCIYPNREWCGPFEWSDYWCKANRGGHLCTDAEIGGIRAWWGWFGGNFWYADTTSDNVGSFHNVNGGDRWYDQDGDGAKHDCRGFYCCQYKY